MFNLGKSGYNTKDELDILIDLGLKYKPDLLIVNFYIDDADFEGYKSTNLLENKIKEMYPILTQQNRKFPHFYYFIIKKIKGFTCNYKFLKCNNYLTHLKEVYTSKNWNKEKNLLKEIRNLGVKNNFETIIVIFPIIVDQSDKYGLKETYTFLKKELEQENFLVLNLYEYYKNYDFESLWINTWDSHPNEKGHEIAAKAIYNFLIEEKLIPDAENRTTLST